MKHGDHMIDRFTNPRFKQDILGIARAYGRISFWEENLGLDMNPEATWRAVLVCACLDQPKYAPTFVRMLRHPDSRVRAWACFGLGQCQDQRFLPHLEFKTNDGSGRVSMHARHALAALGGPRLKPHQHMRQKRLALVSEDNEHDRAVFSAVLATKGYETVTAGTARETIALAAQHHPTVITTDNQKYRDNLSGLFMTQDISRNADLMDSAILMITQDEIEAAFLWHGGDLYLHKVFVSLEDITDAVDELCG